MAISESQLATKIKTALDYHSDDPNVDIEAARQQLANDLAAAVAEYVVGRQTTVTGTSATGGAVTGTGTIKSTP